MTNQLIRVIWVIQWQYYETEAILYCLQISAVSCNTKETSRDRDHQQIVSATSFERVWKPETAILKFIASKINIVYLSSFSTSAAQSMPDKLNKYTNEYYIKYLKCEEPWTKNMISIVVASQ